MTTPRLYLHAVSARTVLLTALLLAGPALAGCVGPETGGGSGTAAAPAASEAPDGAPATSAGEPALATYGASGEPATVWANDSFQAHEPVAGSFPVELVFGFEGDGPHQMDEDFHDVTDHVPQGVPTNISATVTYPDEQASMNLFVTTGEDVLFHDFSQAQGSDSARVWTTLSRFGDSSVEVVVNSNNPGQAAETPYQLRVTVAPAAGTVPAEAATAVPVPDGADRLRVTPVDADEDLVARAWGSDDAYLGARAAQAGRAVDLTVEAGGEHVIVTSAPAHVQALGPDGDPVPAAGEMRTLEWAFETAARTPLDPVSGTASFEMTADRTPLSTWVAVSSGDGGSQPGTPLVGADAVVESPEGTVLEADPACGPFCTVVLTRLDGGWFTGDLAPLDQPAIVDGTYEGQVQADAPTANAEVLAGWLHYER